MRSTTVILGAICAMSGLAGPASASNDPVRANPNTGANFNRYAYANNNPYRFTDPDGREVKYALVNGATYQNQTDTMGYLGTSSTAAGAILQLVNSNETYTIKFDPSSPTGYDRDSRTITVNPTEGLRVTSSGQIQSPALGAYHEISHATQHDKIGTTAMAQSLEAPVVKIEGTTFTYGDQP